MKIAFAGCGVLVERMIDAVRGSLPAVDVAAVVLSKAMSTPAIDGMRSFCAARSLKAQFGFQELHADLILTPNYPLLLKPEIFQSCPCVNVHFALLPKYRGYHPVQCALLNDEREVGYTVHRVDASVDGGPVYFQERQAVGDDDNIHTLNQRLSDQLIGLTPAYVERLLAGAQPGPQDATRATWGGRRVPADGLIDWTQPSRTIFNLVRAVTPPYYPGAFTYWGPRKVVVSRVREQSTTPYRHIPGQVVEANPGRGLLVKTGDTLVWVERVSIDGGDEGPAHALIGPRVGLRFSAHPAG